MSEWKETLFSELLIESKDGEWGQGESAVGLEMVEVIRGTDFSKINNPQAILPIRWVKSGIVKRKKLFIGDILIETAGGTANQSTGRTALLKQSFFQKHNQYSVLCASFSRFLRLKTNRYNPKFIFYLLQGLYKAGYMGIYNLQHTGISRFQYTTFKEKTVLNIPSLPTQKKIAAILSTYDDLIENNNHRIALLEKMAEEIYREWFVRLRFPGYEQVAFHKGVPDGWERKRFDEFCLLQRGYDLPDDKVKPGKYPVVASTTIKTYHNEFKVHPPVITTGRSGSLGTVLLINTQAWALNTTLFVKNFYGNSAYLIYYTLKFLRLENFNSGAGVPTLNRNHLGSLYMSIPPKTLQDNFDKKISVIFEKKELLAKSNDILKQTRDRLLTRLISGKLSVEELDIQFPPSMAE